MRSSASSYEFGPNVIIWTESIVERVTISDGRANGVWVSKKGTSGRDRVHVFANLEIILSAGAQASPKILMLRYVTLLNRRVGELIL